MVDPDDGPCGHCDNPACDGSCEAALAERAESQPDWGEDDVSTDGGVMGALAVYCAGDRVIARDSDYSVQGHPMRVHEDDGSLCVHPGPIRIGDANTALLSKRKDAP